jgi:hypothetical protein
MRTAPAGSSVSAKPVWLDSLDGDLSFNPSTPSFDHDGQAIEITVTGVKSSAAQGTTYIQVRIASATGPICEVLPLTVFEGVIIKFKGTFFSAVNNATARGPGIGPAQCEAQPPMNLVINNQVNFTNPPVRRPWSPDAYVTVISVFAKKPNLNLADDPLVGKTLRLDSTFFFERDPMDPNLDQMLGFKPIIGPSGGSAIMTGQAPTMNIDLQGALNPNSEEVAYFQAQANALVYPLTNPCYANLLQRLIDSSNPLGAGIYFKISANWNSEELKMQLGPSGSISKAARAFIQKQGAGTCTLRMKMNRYNWITLTGDVDESLIETKD